ncbi:MAG: hypothetical protein KIT22_15660 [Verrucomicrobiae bacterium]|nr:hypothetical protein [Verrucomicrobiae bacterium]
MPSPCPLSMGKTNAPDVKPVQVPTGDILDDRDDAPAKDRSPGLDGLAGCGVFLAAMLLLHGFQPELSPLEQAMSYYVHGPRGRLATLGLFGLAFGSLALACAASLIAFLASLMPVFLRPGPPILLGLTERLLFCAYLSWIVAAALGMALRQNPGPRDEAP